MGSAPSANSISGDSYSGDFDEDYEQLVILFPQLQPAKIEAMLKLLKSKEKALDKVCNQIHSQITVREQTMIFSANAIG